jgi:hypothetical protein
MQSYPHAEVASVSVVNALKHFSLACKSLGVTATRPPFLLSLQVTRCNSYMATISP